MSLPPAGVGASAVAGPLAATGRRLLVLLNPTAGAGRRRHLQAVLSALRQAGAEPRLCVPANAAEVRRLAAESGADACDAVVAAGGDGTIAETVRGLGLNPHPPALGVLPLGTANVFARNLGLPAAPDALARVLARAPAAPFRPGRVNGRPFIAMAGIGFDARVVAGVDPALKRRLGKGAYVWRSATELLHHRPRRFEVCCNGRCLTAAGVVAARGPRYGGGFMLAPGARLDRPSLQLYCLVGGRRRDIARQALALALGHFERLPGLEVLTCDSAWIDGPADEPVQADGDPAGHLPARIDIAESPIHVIGLRARD